jgi:glutamine phosphoribosylpyrophosphate amidotransferase
VRFYTENDSEIIGIYLCEAIQAGATFAEALQNSVQFFDGSFSYLAATASEFGFAKDPFGFKPLIVAESDDYIAIATEEVALRAACGAAVETWEPPAGTVQTWSVCQERDKHAPSPILAATEAVAP